jgi:hypothetical protein
VPTTYGKIGDLVAYICAALTAVALLSTGGFSGFRPR